MAKFIVVRADQQQELEFDKQEIVVGREEGCEIYLPNDVAISRLHCKIIKKGENFVVIDLNSKNGTYVNGQRITEKILEIGDKIKVGKTKIYFQQRIPLKHVWKYVLPESFSMWAKTKTKVPLFFKVIILVAIVVMAVVIFKSLIKLPEKTGRQQNLLKDDLEYWQIPKNATIKPSSPAGQCIFIEIQPNPKQYVNECTYKQKILVSEGDVFEVGCYAKAERLRGKAYVKVAWFSKNFKLLEEASLPFSVSNKRNWFSYTFVTPQYATHMLLSLVVVAKGGRVYFDTIRLIRSEQIVKAVLMNAGGYKIMIGDSGALTIIKDERVVFSNLFFGLKSYKDGFSPQVFCSDKMFLNQIGSKIELKGSLINPVNLESISYLQKIMCDEHGFQINYEFASGDVRLLDEFVLNFCVPKVTHLSPVKGTSTQIPFYQGKNEILLNFNPPVKIDFKWMEHVDVKTSLKIESDFSSFSLSVKESVVDWGMVKKLKDTAISLYNQQKFGEAYEKFEKFYHLTADATKKRFAKRKMEEILKRFQKQKTEMQLMINNIFISLNKRLLKILKQKWQDFYRKFKGLEGVETILNRCKEIEGILAGTITASKEQRAKALLNLGKIFYNQKKFTVAKDILKSIVQNYPKTEAFSDALDLLQKIKE
jgi:pSer/pThr/pTyr-binding forkhead associated (FHA) protein